jgi:putative selenate reductase molybdopterin-binding subunit
MSLRLATGAAAFAGDLRLPNLLHVALRRSPRAHARVRRVDAGAAAQLPGVAALLTSREAPAVLRDVARFVGDRLAAAAAEELETARRAAELVELDLEALPERLDAWDPRPDEAAVAGRLAVVEGDVERALVAAEHVIEGEWTLPFTPGASLEPPVALSWLDEDRRLVVRTSAESPFRVRGALAERLELPAARIRVLRPAGAGGSLGRADLAVEDVCALVTLRTGRPARLALSAEEALALSPGRPAQRVRLRLGLARGEIAALDAALVVDVGATEGDASELLRAAARHALGLYRVPSLRVTARAIRTHRPPACAPRGADAGLAWALECALDEAAARLALDPAALRRAHLRRPGDPGASALEALGETAGGDDARQLAELLRALRPAGPGEDSVGEAGPLRHGRGVAVARRADAAGPSGAATLRLLDDGSFTLAAGPTATGSADERLYADAAAAILGVPARRVVCAASDTDSAPYLTGDDAPASSAAGRAVEQAATLARDLILAAGARLLGVSPDRAVLADGRVREPSGRAVGFAEIGKAALSAGEPIDATARPAGGPVRHSLAAALAEVEVDRETGQVHARRLQAVVAAGPFEDARPAAAQLEGALADAFEQALVAGSGAPDPLPAVAATDVPPLVVSFVPSGDPLSRFGTAAHAEAASRAALAALANAIARAADARPRALPLDPARLLAAITEPEARR